MKIVISSIAFCFFFYTTIQYKISARKVILSAYDNILMTKKGFIDLNSFLQKNGALYHYGKWINPGIFIIITFLITLSCFMVGSYYGMFVGIIAACIGSGVSALLLDYLTQQDNLYLLEDLNLIYGALSLQIKAGVFITDALTECFSSVKNRRLQDGLRDLASEIVMNNDIEEGLIKLQSKFNNYYIDSLCITILQALDSGQAIELLKDIAEQIKDLEMINQSMKKEKLNRNITFYQLGIFAIVLIIVLYACFTKIFTTQILF